jgi:ABC-type thiamine transport system ATPase subunit
MTTVDVSVTTKVSRSARARQMEGMFDVPGAPKQTLTWQFEAPIEERDWSVGLIVGPSGAGKSTIARHLFGEERVPTWGAASVMDDFDGDLSMNVIAGACQAVGFNTIPAWLRPYSVLSTGERFRVDLARRLVESHPGDVVMVDEFTSVVDRQVAKIGAHAVQKWIRKRGDRQFVAVSCHADIIDWLQPDWVIEPAERRFSWRSVQPRPQLEVEIAPVGYGAWNLFAPFHYLTKDLNRVARCFALFVEGEPVAFAGVLRRPHPKAKDIMGVSRLVTLPDWQGLGLAFVLVDTLGAAYKAVGERLHTYPAHPALIHGFDRSPKWALKQRPGYGGTGVENSGGRKKSKLGAHVAPPSQANLRTKAARAARRDGNSRGIVHGPNAELVNAWRHGSRPCAVFSYAGEAMDSELARHLLAPYLKGRTA